MKKTTILITDKITDKIMVSYKDVWFYGEPYRVIFFIKKIWIGYGEFSFAIGVEISNEDGYVIGDYTRPYNTEMILDGVDMCKIIQIYGGTKLQAPLCWDIIKNMLDSYVADDFRTMSIAFLGV